VGQVVLEFFARTRAFYDRTGHHQETGPNDHPDPATTWSYTKHPQCDSTAPSPTGAAADPANRLCDHRQAKRLRAIGHCDVLTSRSAIMQVAAVLYPGVTALDMVGPFEVAAFVPGVETVLVAERRRPGRQ